VFCRRCWANLPDGTPHCPRCQEDLTAPAPPPPVAPPPRSAHRSIPYRLDVLLLVLFVVLLGGGWFVAIQRSGSPTASRASSSQIGQRDLPGLTELRSLPSGTAAVVEMNEAALASLRQGQIADACRMFTRALELEPGHATLQANLAHCLARDGWESLNRGEIEKARALFEQGLALIPSDASLLGGLGVVHLRNGDATQALPLLEEAQRVSPASPDLRLRLAQLYLERDDADRAVAHLRAILDREPGHAEALRLLAKIEREREAEAGYYQDESRHFVIKYRGRDSATRRAVLDGLERAYDRIGRELDVTPGERMAVILYPETVFREVTRVHPWAQGLFDGKIRIPVVSEKTEGLDRIVAHELAHAVIHRLSQGRAPLWLQEGLAQELEGQGEASRLLALRGLPRSELPPLDALDSLIRSSEEDHVRRGYLLAWSGVRFLLDRQGIRGVRELLGRLGRGQPWENAFQSVYGQPFRESSREWAALLARS